MCRIKGLVARSTAHPMQNQKRSAHPRNEAHHSRRTPWWLILMTLTACTPPSNRVDNAWLPLRGAMLSALRALRGVCWRPGLGSSRCPARRQAGACKTCVPKEDLGDERKRADERNERRPGALRRSARLDAPRHAPFPLVPKLQLGNPVLAALAARNLFASKSLQDVRSQGDLGNERQVTLVTSDERAERARQAARSAIINPGSAAPSGR